jgi:hypothetical protein
MCGDDEHDEASRQRLYHLATMAGSLAPKSSYGMPSQARRQASRQAWREASAATKAVALAYWFSCACGVVAMLIFIAVRNGLAVVVSVSFLVIVLTVGVAVQALTAGRRGAARSSRGR